jgi:hypothetical protein
MDLKKHILEVLSTDWTPTDEIADILSVKFPNEISFDKDYRGDKKALSQALGPTLHGMKNQALVEDDGTKWPGVKKWRRIEKDENISVDVVVKSLMMLGYSQSENQALRILAMRAIRENPEDYKKIVEEAKKIEETKKKLLKKALGTEKKTNGKELGDSALIQSGE